MAANVLEHGTGALNIDGCQIAAEGRAKREADYKDVDASAYAGRMDGSLRGGSKAAGTTDLGRWPANVLLDEAAAAMLDEQSGVLPAGVAVRHHSGGNTFGGDSPKPVMDDLGYGDSGGASRFFYVAKASTAERPKVDGVAHATVKPLELMRWLVRLVTPPGGLVLDPFAGTGTTAEACIVEGFRCVLVEKEADHLPLVLARLTKPIQPTLLRGAS